MRSEIKNQKVIIINESFDESFATLNEMLNEMGHPSLTENQAKLDWGIIGGETNAQLQEWANDYNSENATEMAAEKQAWRYAQ